MADKQRGEASERWSHLVKEAIRDESLKRRLIDNPAAVLEEHGMTVRPGLEVRVVENTDKVAYLTLPAKPAQGELTMEQMEQVAGGRGSTAPTISEIVVTKKTDTSSTTLF